MYKRQLFYLETLRTIFTEQEEKNGFSPLLSMQFLAPEEIEEEPSREEYLHFVEYCKSHYLIEFMRIGKEITPYNTVGHICGVHFVAMHIARQLSRAGVPVDLALSLIHICRPWPNLQCHNGRQLESYCRRFGDCSGLPPFPAYKQTGQAVQ